MRTYLICNSIGGVIDVIKTATYADACIEASTKPNAEFIVELAQKDINAIKETNNGKTSRTDN